MQNGEGEQYAGVEWLVAEEVDVDKSGADEGLESPGWAS